MQTQTEKRYYSREEYLALEETAEYKSEYHDGEIVPMTGGTTNHNEILGNLFARLKLALRGRGYRVFASDVRLWVSRYRRYFYPDIMIIQGEPVYEGGGNTTVTNPSLIVEVLSDSTRNYDKGDKFDYYRSLPEFREYILIDQYKFHIEQLVKTAEGKWLLTYYESADGVLALDSVDFQIPLSDIYEGVNFDIVEE
ncbi:Uma2 family endonuclease [Planktothrix sp. FACHB-1355]|uniref:Uma2 family endonuclease n=1 Tax=Aerosakkonema funiforme FACHB-1375 TaxID=2949571 RepID=A0A926V9W9_9CYAN|nr:MULTISPECIES: Uma2 family endonuclease [Oscillatoriales]MBD2179938.1 Uma2 family endonuclease [Aerosakkonema funiforme FACHB-1375]MBD3560865.1 Uma2 family endonuclease [Planktothrix sp. FACHB-1355]